jgi:transposase
MNLIRRIIELYSVNELSDRQISTLTKVSRPTVGHYLQNWKASAIDLDTFRTMSDTDAQELITMGNRKADPRLLEVVAYFPAMVVQLKRAGVTREVMWNEYRVKHPQGYTYSRFCFLYQVWRGSQSDTLSMHFDHKAGELAYYDWAGKLSVRITDPRTGIQTTPEIFVGILGASQYTYAEACVNQQLPYWIQASRNSFEYFGGVPAGIVPDAYKGAVTKACKYDPLTNHTYADFAQHYGTVILPARPYKPKDKSLVEGAVKILYSRIFAVLRDQVFHSIDQLNEALWLLLDVHNRRNFQRLAVSRQELWKTIDLPALKPLPKNGYEYRSFALVKVQNTYHIRLPEADGDHYYSVPWRLVGKQVTVVSSLRTVEIFHDNLREAFHRRVFLRGWTTVKEHMPEHHRFVAAWSPDRICGWAREIGPAVELQCRRIMGQFEYPEHGYKSCIGLIKLADKWSGARVQAASSIALSRDRFGYRAVKAILVNDEDKILTHPAVISAAVTTTHENLRGQAAYS